MIMEEESGVHSSHQTCPPIHGHGGKFLLHGGILENLTGEEDFDRPAAGLTSEELNKQQRFSGDEFVRGVDEPYIPRPMDHSPGHGGNFHLHGGHLEHVIGDEDNVDRPAAGMSTDELDRQQSEESSTSPLDPAIPRPAEHMSGHGGNFHLHGGHLEHVIGDEDSVDRPAAGMSSDELDRQQSEESSTSPLDPAIPRPPEHMSGHGGNFHLHGGHLEHVIGDDDIISRPPAGINSHQFDSERTEDSTTAVRDPAIPRPPEHMSGHGGNFHLHGGHLEYAIGDADIPNPPAAGMTTTELSELH